jgi:hypothetical protein
MRAALLSCLISLSFVLCQSAQAKSQLDSATLKQLTMLEQKFFGHSYATESDDERTQRIEKLIFGTASEGSAGERIKKLAAVTLLDTRPDPIETPQPVAAAPPKVQAVKPVSPEPAPPRKKESPPPAPSRVAAQPPQDDDAEPPSSKPGADDYPHVTALEKEILGSTFVGQPLSGRIVRMESKAFGSPSKSPDLGERTDNLEQFAESKLHKKPFLADEVADTMDDTTGTAGTAGAEQSDAPATLQSAYPHVTALENEILGQAAPDQPLEKRLAAMEGKAFGHASTSDDLGSRTDALERYAEKTLHKKPFGQVDGYETANDGDVPAKSLEGRGMKLLSMVGNSLLGMGGGGMGGGGMAMPGMGGMGMMGPGSMGGPGGFAGMRVRRRQAPQQQQPSAADEPTGPVEDPIVRAKDPPPSSARLATRVGWCEMHVFGKTSPSMHLAERLSALNRELNFEPGKSSMDLMDHIDGLVKSAQAYKAPSPTGPAIGSAPRPAMH